MSFWSNLDRKTFKEPLRQYRWYINFGVNGAGSAIVESKNKDLQAYRYALKEASKPEYKIEVANHTLLNHTFSYPKNLTWTPVTVKMASTREEIHSLSSTLNNTIFYSGYTTPDDETKQSQLSKKKSTFASIDIIQIDANGNMIEKWELKNAFISSINYGTLNYSSEDVVDITITFNYDYAILTVESDLYSKESGATPEQTKSKEIPIDETPYNPFFPDMPKWTDQYDKNIIMNTDVAGAIKNQQASTESARRMQEATQEQPSYQSTDQQTNPVPPEEETTLTGEAEIRVKAARELEHRADIAYSQQNEALANQLEEAADSIAAGTDQNNLLAQQALNRERKQTEQKKQNPEAIQKIIQDMNN